MNDKIYEIKRTVRPVIPLRGMWIFPHTVIHFDAGREKSISALNEALLRDSLILLCAQKDFKVDDPQENDFYWTGTVANIKQILKLPNGSTRVLVEGIHRGIIKKILKREEFFEAEVDEYLYQENVIELDENLKAAMRLVLNDAREYINLSPSLSQDMMLSLMDIEDPGRLSDVISSYLQLKNEDHYEILTTMDVYDRLEKLHIILRNEIELLKIEEKINLKVSKQINKSQKEYYLKEQLHAIRAELGESEEDEDYIEEYIKKINALRLPKHVKTPVMKEANRLRHMGPGSPEINIVRTYLDHILALPWNKETKETIDIAKSREILNNEHYGLTDVKERVLEFIAIRKLTQSMKGPILCLVGPPGVGKTSIARSVAHALNRKFVSMRLGGVRDEAEIRGHRKTYIGAMPGRVITSMEHAESKNPVFLLDEIDKLASDFRGDPASALLEVLDPAQNDSFTDHFLEVPFDLSKVMFITTANSTNTIPAALLDRMEVIRISGYTDHEKLNIAKRHLIPKQLKEHGIGEKNLKISQDALETIINNYTRESGVRNLEREIAKICRRAAKKMLEDKKEIIRVSVNNLEIYLGKKKFLDDDILQQDQIGVVNGLAWTETGGEILNVEANIMNGTGKVQLTGQLGDVMKESAMAAISYIRSHYQELEVSESFHKDKDIHIHVPEGAIPKDGPSAGITMATATVSALSGKKVKHDLAMTGEITLRGRILPIGGVKEKVLAANRYNIKHIVLPLENKRDLDDIPESIRKTIHFDFVKDIKEVLQIAFV